MSQMMNDQNFLVSNADMVVILLTFPAKDEALLRRFARGMVEENLAACVHVTPRGGVSFYQWQDALQEDEEQLVVIKTRQSLVPHVWQWVRENHPYEVPAFLVMDVERLNQSYYKWLTGQTPTPTLET
jgi:periplasmic divalent cation tolerance protein